MFNARKDLSVAELSVVPTNNTDKGKQFLSTQKTYKGD